jgi:hypothetical protein
MKTAALKPANNGVTLQIEETETPPTEYPNRYVTIPPNGRRCEFTGLGHAKLYQILGPNGMARRHVRVANLRTPGAARGQTLFHVGDMLRFLDGLAQESQDNSTN